MNAVSTKVLLRFSPPVCPFDQGKNNNNNSPHATPPPPKEKTWAHHECMLSLPIGCMKSLFPKLLVTIFYLVVTLVVEQIKVNLKHNW
jgi:hypothetical protein